MNVRSRTIEVMGLRTRVIDDGDGVPVVMVHGVGGWAENFRETIAAIAASGRRAIAVDLPGFGESQAPRRVSHFGPRDPFYPHFMTGLFDALGVRTAHLVGHSMGGAVAYMTAVSAPERIRSLTFVAGGGLGTDIAFFLRLASLPGLITFARLVGDRGQGRQVLQTCFFDRSRIPQTLYEEADRYGYRSFPEFVRALRSGVTIRGVKPALRGHWMAQAERYRGPVLVAWGREDIVLPISHLADAKAVFPQAEVRIIERCGHLVMVERPEEFHAALVPFVDRAEAAVAA
jgi:4,5:9,10-diseco-3-hydroxy-5,9,17-trioxoandrosta-1(10),2-diene-4-oate hydrolase